MKSYFIINLLFFTFLTYSSKTLAWGLLGHHTVAQVAQDILTEQKSPALNEVKSILQDEDFVKSSTWADEIRDDKDSNWAHVIWYHFEKMDDSDKYIEHLKVMSVKDQQKGGVIEAILMCEKILKNKSSTLIEKKAALKFLIHFVADIHQPLHTGPKNDNGGNKTIVDWLGFKVTLHSVWDSQMIALGHKDIFSTGERQDQVLKYATLLKNQFVQSQFKDENSILYDEWIHESLPVRINAYKYLQEDAEAYTKRFLPIIDQRIFQAGYRLAFVLNKIFPGYKGENSPTDQSNINTMALKNSIEKIVGDLGLIIKLSPIPTR